MEKTCILRPMPSREPTAFSCTCMHTHIHIQGLSSRESGTFVIDFSYNAQLHHEMWRWKNGHKQSRLIEETYHYVVWTRQAAHTCFPRTRRAFVDDWRHSFFQGSEAPYPESTKQRWISQKWRTACCSTAPLPVVNDSLARDRSMCVGASPPPIIQMCSSRCDQGCNSCTRIPRSTARITHDRRLLRAWGRCSVHRVSHRREIAKQAQKANAEFLQWSKGEFLFCLSVLGCKTQEMATQGARRLRNASCVTLNMILWKYPTDSWRNQWKTTHTPAKWGGSAWDTSDAVMGCRSPSQSRGNSVLDCEPCEKGQSRRAAFRKIDQRS